jgi:hypothetical protein
VINTDHFIIFRDPEVVSQLVLEPSAAHSMCRIAGRCPEEQLSQADRLADTWPGRMRKGNRPNRV